MSEELNVTKWRKKPVEIDAWRLIECPPCDWPAWIADYRHGDQAVIGPHIDGHLMIPTLEGLMRANLGDWIIRGVKGELYPCKPDIFAATYESADTPPASDERRCCNPTALPCTRDHASDERREATDDNGFRRLLQAELDWCEEHPSGDAAHDDAFKKGVRQTLYLYAEYRAAILAAKEEK